MIAPTRRFVCEASLLVMKRNASKAKPVLGHAFLFNDMLVIADRVEEEKEKRTLRNRHSKSDLVAGANAAPPKYRPREVLGLMDFKSHLLKDHLSIQVAATKTSEDFELVLMPVDASDLSSVVDFVKQLSKARLNLESNSSSSNLSKKQSVEEHDSSPTKRTPSDPLTSSSSKIDLLSKRTSSDPSRSSAAAPSDPSPATPPPAALVMGDVLDEAERQRDALAEQTRQSTIDGLNQMIAELEAKVAQLSTSSESETNEDEKKRLLVEAKNVENKLVTLRIALAEQMSGVGALAKQNIKSRSRSSTTDGGSGLSKSRSGFSLRGASKDQSPSASPQPLQKEKKGLFATVRKKKTSDEKE